MTINSPIARKIPREVDITFSPEGTTVGFTIGGDIFTTNFKYTEPNTPITFTAIGDTDQFALFEWDFGDGVREFGNPVVHTYLIENPHLQVKVKATTTDGEFVTASKRIYIERSTLDEGLYPSDSVLPSLTLYPIE